MSLKISGLHNRKSNQVIRSFSKKDHERLLAQYKKHIKRFQKLDTEADGVLFPELVGWNLYVRKNIHELPWSLVEKLLEAKFFDKNERIWLQHFSSLQIFKQVFGHTRVPAKWAKNKKLAHWVHRHRTPGIEIPPEQRALLDTLGFEWRIRPTHTKTSWQEHYQQLIQYKREYGNCNVPAKWAANRSLGSWVSYQRLHKKILDPEHIQALDEIDFDWDVLKNQWENMFQQLRAYKKKYGHCRVPHKAGEYKALGLWVSNVRIRTHLLTPKRKKRLDTLGFCWDPDEEHWQKQYQSLQKFQQEHGHGMVPSTYADRSLACWVFAQRNNFRKEKMTPEHFQQLEAVDFIWDPMQHIWEQRFQEWQSFIQEHGHPYVPVKKYPSNPQLDTWLCSQRGKWKRLSPEKQKRMLSTGWDPTKTRP